MSIELSKKDKVYIDISLSFDANIKTGDITVLKNERAINNSLRNVMNIAAGEVIFQHDVGSSINNYLFDSVDPGTAGILEGEIRRAIKYNEPRVKLIDVIVEDQSEQHQFMVSITYQITGSSTTFTVQEILTPTR
tara:strand:- start:22375 stop:22779 length:405 start_codon:yes stop_codon:yes gene_type:complete